MINVNSNILKEISKEFGTPCYIFDEAQFEENIASFQYALNKFFPDNYAIGYSFKTNYTPGVCQLSKELGCFAEVVSRMELELAERLGFQQGKIIFNGPLKTSSDIEYALKIGAIINLDNIEQVKTVCSFDDAKLKKSRIGLRVNVDLSEKLLAKKLALGGILPRFGMRAEELNMAVRLLKEKNISVVSLHGHSSSSDRAFENYNTIASELLLTRKKYKLDSVKFLDVGGGFYGNVPKEFGVLNPPSFNDYAKSIHEACVADSWYRENLPEIVIEPGMAVVADAVSYITKVVSLRNINSDVILGVDGSYFDIRPTFHKKILPHRLLNTCKDLNKKMSKYIVVGSTCMERDILFEEAILSEVSIDDIIFIGNVGAYCDVLSPNFINYAPPVVSISKDSVFSLLKERQNFSSFFVSYNTL